jgi:hypothetical protein
MFPSNFPNTYKCLENDQIWLIACAYYMYLGKPYCFQDQLIFIDVRPESPYYAYHAVRVGADFIYAYLHSNTMTEIQLARFGYRSQPPIKDETFGSCPIFDYKKPISFSHKK